MASAKLGKEISIETPDEMGTLAKISTIISNAGVNIQVLCAYGEKGKARFLMVTSDNAKAIEALKPLNFKTGENDVVILELEDKIGAMAEVSRRLASAKINTHYIYGSAGQGDGASSLLVFACDDNARAAKLFM